MNKERETKRTIAAIVGLVLASAAAGAQTPPAPEPGAQDLAKQLSNPVADLVSVPFQMNWEEGVGSENGTRFVLNLQPVVPFTLSEEWNLIGRLIVPYVSQPSLAPGGAPASGVSDLVLSAFLSPAKPKGAIWGVGPVFALPSTAEPTVGSGRWSAGPTFVVLKQVGPWTSGMLANHLWSFAGDDARADVNQTFLQPFLAYATPNGVTYSLNSETTANWEAESGEEWTVPVNLAVSKLARFGPFPASYLFGVGYFVESPATGGADWKLRLAMTIILPKAKR